MRRILRALRLPVAAILLAATLYFGFRPAGPAPALGPFLEPAGGVWALARTSELPRNASASISGLQGETRVFFDRRGVPHIFARSEADAYRALGYVVASERLFQMHLQTLAATGRLTEIAGHVALEADREMRGLGLPRAAVAKANATLASGKGSGALAAAYADGVNAYIAQLDRASLPLEFRLLGIGPERWEPVNSAHLFNRMGWTLAHITPEVNRSTAAARVGSAAAEALFPDELPIQEPIQPGRSGAPRFDRTPLPPPGTPDSAQAILASAFASFFPTTAARLAHAEAAPEGFASNNWAVMARRTAAGHALLAGDPHLPLTLPSIWYEVHLVVPGTLDVYGVTIPGAPGIVIGFNRDLAWTFTNTGADVADFFAETVDDSTHPRRYLLDGRWRAVETQVETYRGKNGRLIASDTVYYTHRGPMRHSGGRWLSLRWTVLDVSDEAAGFQRAARAKSVAEFQEAMAAQYWSPAQNMLVADRTGTIALRSTGHFPIRADSGSGAVIRDGSRSASDWRGFLAPEQYPRGLNPSQGYLASANQQPVDPRDVSYVLGGEYDPWRALRINALLRADSQLTPDAMRRYQTDPGSARADLFVPYFLEAAKRVATRSDDGESDRLATAARLLGEWDRRYTRDNRRALLFENAMRELATRTWDELGVPTDDPQRIYGHPVPSGAVLLRLLADSASPWWDDRATHRIRETRDDVLAASLVAAYDETRARHGEPSGGGWIWSRSQRAMLWHPLRLRALSALDVPVQGGPGTLNPSTYASGFGASWRMVVELGPALRVWATYPGGQSGNPFSPRYRDRVEQWSKGELSPLLVPRDSAELRDAVTSVLTLRPSR